MDLRRAERLPGLGGRAPRLRLLVPNFTPADMTESMRNSDGELRLRPEMYERMETWAKDQREEVVEAARQNASVQELEIDIDLMSNDTAVFLSRVISGLECVETVKVENSYGCTSSTNVVDALLQGVGNSASQVKLLSLLSRCSRRAFRNFAERFRDLETLEVPGHCPCGSCDEYYGFSCEVAAAIGPMGLFSSLRRVQLLYGDMQAMSAARKLLDALIAPSTVTELSLSVLRPSIAFLQDVSLFMVSTQAVEFVSSSFIRGPGSRDPDVSPILDIGSAASFSPCLKHVQLLYCRCDRVDEEFLNTAANALQNVTCIYFGRCEIPGVFNLLAKLPRLSTLYCLSRSEHILDHETLEDEPYFIPYLLESNEDLERFCEVVEREDSSLRKVHLDLVSRPTIRRNYPAIERLMNGSKGELVVNLGHLSPTSCEHVVRGLTSVRVDLTKLGIRWFSCDLADRDYAAILQTVGSNKSLNEFELAFDTATDTGTPNLSIGAVRDLLAVNDTLHGLSLRGLDSEAAVAALEQIMPVLSTANRSLRILDMYDVDLTDSWSAIGGQMLAMLKQNGVFAELAGCSLPEDEADAHKVRYLLKQNLYGRQFLLEPEGTPSAIWPTILGRISTANEHAVMYKFLRANAAGIMD